MLTDRQLVLLRTIKRCLPRGVWFDIDELIDELVRRSEFVGTKQSLQCSIRYLEERGYLCRIYETRRGRKRMVPTLTTTAMALAL